MWLFCALAFFMFPVTMPQMQTREDMAFNQSVSSAVLHGNIVQRHWENAPFPLSLYPRTRKMGSVLRIKCLVAFAPHPEKVLINYAVVFLLWRAWKNIIYLYITKLHLVNFTLCETSFTRKDNRFWVYDNGWAVETKSRLLNLRNEAIAANASRWTKTQATWQWLSFVTYHHLKLQTFSNKFSSSRWFEHPDTSRLQCRWHQFAKQSHHQCEDYSLLCRLNLMFCSTIWIRVHALQTKVGSWWIYLKPDQLTTYQYYRWSFVEPRSD